MDNADLVGYIVGEHSDGRYIYNCEECAAPWAKAESHRALLREEAAEEGATCAKCGLELAEVGFAR